MERNWEKYNRKVDGQYKWGLEGDGTVGEGDAKPGCVEAIMWIAVAQR